MRAMVSGFILRAEVADSVKQGVDANSSRRQALGSTECGKIHTIDFARRAFAIFDEVPSNQQRLRKGPFGARDKVTVL